MAAWWPFYACCVMEVLVGTFAELSLHKYPAGYTHVMLQSKGKRDFPLSQSIINFRPFRRLPAKRPSIITMKYGPLLCSNQELPLGYQGVHPTRKRICNHPPSLPPSFSLNPCLYGVGG